jgi:hypothetical protein
VSLFLFPYRPLATTKETAIVAMKMTGNDQGRVPSGR